MVAFAEYGIFDRFDGHKKAARVFASVEDAKYWASRSFSVKNNRLAKVAEVSRESLVEELESALGSHDWYYERTEDKRVRAKGSESYWKIQKLVELLGEEGKEMFRESKPEIK